MTRHRMRFNSPRLPEPRHRKLGYKDCGLSELRLLNSFRSRRRRNIDRIKNVPDVATKMWPQNLTALVYLTPVQGLCRIQRSAHPCELRSLPGKKEHDIGSLGRYQARRLCVTRQQLRSRI